MKSQKPTTNAQNLSTGIHQSNVPKEKSKNGPTLDEIRLRTLEIHIERGGQGQDPDNFVDEWLQAEREPKERYNHSNSESPKSK